MGGGERIRVVTVVAALALVMLVGACKPLREYPAAKAMFFGTSVRYDLLADPTYASTLAREFGGLAPENELKWGTVHPQQFTYNFGPADTIVNFARAHDMKIRGVPLVWPESTPEWFSGGRFNRGEVREILRDHINRVMGRYRGSISQWDVVNEPFMNDGTLRNSMYYRLGPNYMDEAFAMARAADPTAKLFLNERGIEFAGPKANATFAAVSSMKARGVPVDGVGLQMHATTSAPSLTQLAAQIARYASIGVEVAITEMDVRLPVPASPALLQEQARVYRDTLATCRAAPNCNTFVVWGFTDRWSWIPTFYPGWGQATVLDSEFAKKPAYDALNDHLSGLSS